MPGFYLEKGGHNRPKNRAYCAKERNKFMKEILVLVGSPHSQGATAKMIEVFLRPFQNEGFHISFFDTYRERPAPCTGCGWCASHEECAIHDCCDQLDKQLRSCDLLVVASPVYNLTFPAPLKAVLDRFQRYFEARFSLRLKPSILKHRLAVLLVAAGADTHDGPGIMERQLKQCFSVMNTTLESTVAWLSTDRGEIRWKETEMALTRLSLAIFQKM